LVRRKLIGQPIPQTLSFYDARSSYLQTSAGSDWFALGDARFAPDPLSGQGIILALQDAIFAAEALKACVDIAEALAQRMRTEVAEYIAIRNRVYAMEGRFTGDPYWSNSAEVRKQPEHDRRSLVGSSSLYSWLPGGARPLRRSSSVDFEPSPNRTRRDGLAGHFLAHLLDERASRLRQRPSFRERFVLCIGGRALHHVRSHRNPAV
jgi:hypothetical protein